MFFYIYAFNSMFKNHSSFIVGDQLIDIRPIIVDCLVVLYLTWQTVVDSVGISKRRTATIGER